MKSDCRSAVYMAECRDATGTIYAKVGMTNNVFGRLPSLQTGCPFEFERVRFVNLPTRAKAAKAEKRCHSALRKYHLRGGGRGGCWRPGQGPFAECRGLRPPPQALRKNLQQIARTASRVAPSCTQAITGGHARKRFDLLSGRLFQVSA